MIVSRNTCRSVSQTHWTDKAGGSCGPPAIVVNTFVCDNLSGIDCRNVDVLENSPDFAISVHLCDAVGGKIANFHFENILAGMQILADLDREWR